MIDFYAFSDELIKIAEAAGDIPVIGRLPRDANEAMDYVKTRIDKSQQRILGHKNVAVPVGRFGNLEQHGFKKTRLAVPHPGEWIGTPTWRKGDLHAHKKGEHYLMHKDKISPSGVRAAVKHWFHEGLPATRKRLGNKRVISIAGVHDVDKE